MKGSDDSSGSDDHDDDSSQSDNDETPNKDKALAKKKKKKKKPKGKKGRRIKQLCHNPVTRRGGPEVTNQGQLSIQGSSSTS
jgi:hypothetical protein